MQIPVKSVDSQACPLNLQAAAALHSVMRERGDLLGGC